MSSRVLAGLLAAGCLTAAAGGAYIAVRQNVVQPAPVAASPAPIAAPASAPSSSAGTPVSETEAIVNGPTKAKAEAEPSAPSPSAPSKSAPSKSAVPAPAASKDTPKATSSPRRSPTPDVTPKPRTTNPSASQNSTPVTAERQAPSPPPVPPPRPEPVQDPVRVAEPPPAPPVRQFEEVVLPAASVMGLEVETSLSSERARVEDRVDAKVARDVVADGHVAIPAGSRVIGSVTVVERGGKVKQPARLGVRFHTLVLADGREIPLRTEPIYREGESPGSESARKIGGAAVGGAILGAILGGGKGAVIGGATGAAGGTAVVMAGDRNAATLTPGTVVNVRLSAPATIEVEKRDQQQ